MIFLKTYVYLFIEIQTRLVCELLKCLYQGQYPLKMVLRNYKIKYVLFNLVSTYLLYLEFFYKI